MMERGKRSSLTSIGDDGLTEGNLKWNIDFDNLLSKEIFIDFDEYRSEYLIYVINHDKKIYVPYIHKYSVGLYDAILEKCNEFDIEVIGLYGIRGGMFWLYRDLSSSSYDVYDRDDIYQWRMKLNMSIRNITRPMYYYEVQGYIPMLKEDYMMKL